MLACGLLGGDQTREFTALRQGVIDGMVASTINIAPQIREMNLFSLPFLMPNSRAFTKDRRFTHVLREVRRVSGWDDLRWKPAETGSVTVVHGRGVSAIFRHSAYWACVCEIVVDRESGRVGVQK